MPSVSLLIEHGLYHGEPIWNGTGWFGEVSLGGNHGTESPEALIIVSLCVCLVLGHEVTLNSSLMNHRLPGDLIVGIIASI